MNVKNYSVVSYNKGIRHKNNIIPNEPLRLLITGPSGCGKTNLLLNFIHDYLNKDFLYLYAKVLNEPDYERLKENIFYDIEKEDIKKFSSGKNKKLLLDAFKREKFPAHFSDSIENIKEVKTLNPNLKNLVVFDDFCMEKNQEEICNYFIYGRKFNADVIYITQKYHQCPKIIRDNCNYFIIFNLNSKEINNILNEIEGLKNIKKFIELSKYEFFEIDKTKSDKLRYRKNFEPLII